MRDPATPVDLRIRAATVAAPFIHERATEAKPGKKDRAAAAAKTAARGRFAPPSPPRLIVDNDGAA
jgi:hypothetical protein